jgi:hypothetical protein
MRGAAVVTQRFLRAAHWCDMTTIDEFAASSRRARE